MAQREGLIAAWFAAAIGLAACVPPSGGEPTNAPAVAERLEGPATLTMSLPEGIGLARGSVEFGIATVQPNERGFSISLGTQIEMTEVAVRELPGGRQQHVLGLDAAAVARLFGPDGEASRVGPGAYPSLTLGYRFCRTGRERPGAPALIVTRELVVGARVVEPRQSRNLRDDAQGRFLQGVEPCAS